MTSFKAIPSFSLSAPLPIPGLRLASTGAGIRYQNRDDLVLFAFAEGSQVAGVFTQNQFVAAPVILCREHQQHCSPRALLINSGNANAGTGAPGLAAAKKTCADLAEVLEIEAAQVWPFSTGVIGNLLPAEKITAALPALKNALSEDLWTQAANAIMTTDQYNKVGSVVGEFEGKTFTITGMAKGAGMIKPNMATMLSFVATDLSIDGKLLQELLTEVTDLSFNRITVDGDTSTNDSCVLVATAQNSLPMITSKGSALYQLFREKFLYLMSALAQLIVRDGEGATRLVQVVVSGGPDEKSCQQIAETIAHSPLVKTALFAGDPNWGRIIAATGRAGVPLQMDKVTLSINEQLVFVDGGIAPGYQEPKASQDMKQREVVLTVHLGLGQAEYWLWTTDLNHDYVTINAEYRT